MRIAHIVPTLASGGVERSIEYLSRASGLDNPSLIVSIFGGLDRHPMGYSFAEAIDLALPLALFDRPAEITTAIVQALRSWNPQVVHSHHVFADIYALPAAKILDAPAKVRTIHGILQVSPSDGFKKTFIRTNWDAFEVERERAVESHCDRTICVSEALARCMAHHGIPAKKIAVIPNGVDLARFSPAALPDRSACRIKFGLKSHDFVVGFLGRLEPVKNVCFLVAVARQLRARRSHASFLVVGSGPDEGLLRAELATSGLSDDFKLNPFDDDVLSFYAAVDAVIIPSHSEGCPFVVLEAMACGLPVAAATVDGMLELVEDGKTGALFPRGDVDAAVDCIIALHAPQTRAVRSKRARQKALLAFGVNNFTAKTLALYDELVNGREIN